MTQTAQTIRPGTGLVPEQRTPARPAVPGAGTAPGRGLADAARRAFAVARGLRSLRPVPARPQEPYGESDGQ
ncbi:hypothetical protein [Saccharothrix sp. ST-888]|uniref:hypothetical protein n=1 Tax=Saccharothrix sp. ST-888 TaxID=1427391 RepID=UPI0005EBFC78|nr:hypothetical protein [Saccharothrix sp. ST-888]KJK58525.1 hypothetical protein UK12_09715 [Saccharothrix sp. ST-888]